MTRAQHVTLQALERIYHRLDLERLKPAGTLLWLVRCYDPAGQCVERLYLYANGTTSRNRGRIAA